MALCRTINSIVLISVAALVGCGSDDGQAPIGPDASGSEAGPPPATIDGGAGPSGIVVVNSNYDDSSSVSFLDRDGRLLKDGCFNSGTGATVLTATLSGDVVLPTQVPPGGPIPLIDRDRRYNTVTWLDPATCAPLGQLAVGTGFYSNPHDVVTLSAAKAYVTRYNENGAATQTPDDFDDGNDLLIIDPSQPKILGRIDLKPFAPTGVVPCADHALLADGKVYVSLNAVSSDWKTTATGRIVVVDPTLDQVIETIDLPNTKNCGAMTYLPAERKLMVACMGAFSDGPQQADTSAVVTLDLSVSPPAVIALIPAASVGGVPFSNASLAAPDGQSALAVTLGNLAGLPPDQVWSLPMSGALPSRVFTSTGGYTVGALLVDAEIGRLFVADAPDTGALLHIFDSVLGTFSAGATINTSPSTKLPPRALAWY
jgi:hypothetical protein